MCVGGIEHCNGTNLGDVKLGAYVMNGNNLRSPKTCLHSVVMYSAINASLCNGLHLQEKKAIISLRLKASMNY